MSLGKITITGQAQIILDFGLNEARYYLKRHAAKDWGIVSDSQRQRNRRYLREQRSRVISVYQTPKGYLLGIVTRFYKGQILTTILTKGMLETELGQSVRGLVCHNCIKGIVPKFAPWPVG